MRVCYPEEMRLLDSIAINEYNIPGIVLMENAALACVSKIEKHFEDLHKLSVAILCGKGNNGGDGFAIARHLFNKGCNVNVFLTSGEPASGDSRTNYDICKKIGIKITDYTNDCDFKCYDLIVDAIFGTGFSGVVKEECAIVIGKINESKSFVLSVDVPSGIYSENGEISNVCVNADVTVTFGAYKTGLLMYPAADFAGDVVVVDISIPDAAFEKINSNINTIDNKLFADNMPKRKNNSHKGDYGKLLVIAGSKGLSGAAYLCSQSAMLSGSGLVTLAIPECINDVLEAKTTEVMTLPLPYVDGHIAKEAFEVIKSMLNKVDAVLIGPGLGVSEDSVEVVKKLIAESKVPLIIDADAINCLKGKTELLKNKQCDVILTPHTVEFSRLSGLSIDEIEQDRLAISKDFAMEYGVTVILKGNHTIVTGTDGMQYINMTGNPALATGGSGDVLAGIVSSYVGRNVPMCTSSAMAVYIHGICGDIASEIYCQESVMAGNVMECIPKAYNQILQVEK